MALAMMGGLIAATILTLTFLPALYATWFRVRRIAPEAGAEGDIDTPLYARLTEVVRLEAAE
jgi:hypothetical protein